MIIKTKSELLLDIKTLEVNTETGIITFNIELRNPRFNPASLVEGKFYLNNTWFPMSLTDNQDYDLDNIPLSGRSKIISIKWDAVKDLRAMQAYSNIMVYLTFNDRSYTAGQNANPLYLNIPLIDFQITSIKSLIYPYGNDPYFKIKFVNKATARDSKMHFLIEIGTDSKFSNIVAAFDSSEDVSGWTIDGESFPEIGIDGNIENIILFESEILEALPEANYYIRITPTSYQFYVDILYPEKGQVYISNTIDISGIVVALDE